MSAETVDQEKASRAADKPAEVNKAAQAAEQALDTLREKSDALGEALDKAEDKHSVKLDHAVDGGVI